MPNRLVALSTTTTAAATTSTTTAATTKRPRKKARSIGVVSGHVDNIPATPDNPADTEGNPLHARWLSSQQIQALVAQGVQVRRGKFSASEDETLLEVTRQFLDDRQLTVDTDLPHLLKKPKRGGGVGASGASGMTVGGWTTTSLIAPTSTTTTTTSATASSLIAAGAPPTPTPRTSIDNAVRREFLRTVCAHFPERALPSLYHRIHRLFHPGNHQGRWSEEDVRTLFSLVQQFGKDWQRIGERLARMPESCRSQWKSKRFYAGAAGSAAAAGNAATAGGDDREGVEKAGGASGSGSGSTTATATATTTTTTTTSKPILKSRSTPFARHDVLVLVTFLLDSWQREKKKKMGDRGTGATPPSPSPSPSSSPTIKLKHLRRLLRSQISWSWTAVAMDFNRQPGISCERNDDTLRLKWTGDLVPALLTALDRGPPSGPSGDADGNDNDNDNDDHPHDDDNNNNNNTPDNHSNSKWSKNAEWTYQEVCALAMDTTRPDAWTREADEALVDGYVLFFFCCTELILSMCVCVCVCVCVNDDCDDWMTTPSSLRELFPEAEQEGDVNWSRLSKEAPGSSLAKWTPTALQRRVRTLMEHFYPDFYDQDGHHDPRHQRHPRHQLFEGLAHKLGALTEEESRVLYSATPPSATKKKRKRRKNKTEKGDKVVVAADEADADDSTTTTTTRARKRKRNPQRHRHHPEDAEDQDADEDEEEEVSLEGKSVVRNRTTKSAQSREARHHADRSHATASKSSSSNSSGGTNKTTTPVKSSALSKEYVDDDEDDESG